MNDKNHKDFIKDFKNFSDNLLKSESDVRKFFKDAGVHTETGRLTKNYSEKPSIGYKPSIPTKK